LINSECYLCISSFAIGAGLDLEFYHDGTDSYINNNTGNLKIGSDNGIFDFRTDTADTDLTFNFLGTTNSGVLAWMEDEDYFKFSDKIAFAGSTSGAVTIQSAAAAGTWTMTLPTDDGEDGQQLQTNGSGVTSWAAAGSSKGIKNIIGTADSSTALNQILETSVYRFHYKEGEGTLYGR